MSTTNVLVIGAGPIGIETAAALQADGHKVMIIDAGAIGATIARTFPPHTRFFTSPERLEIAGFAITPTHQEKLTGEEYRAYLCSVVATLGLSVRTYETATAITRTRDGFRIATVNRAGALNAFECHNLVLATGGTDTPRSLRVPGEDLPHVQHDLGDPLQYFGRRVLVVGGRNSAAESALRIYRAGGHVRLSYRHSTLNARVKFWLKPEVESLMREGLIRPHLPSVVERIEPDAVVLRDAETGHTTAVEVDDVLLQIGFEQSRAVFDLAGITTSGEQRAPELNPATLESSQSGIYVVGTAVAGTQDRYSVFIESCHPHAEQVAAAIGGRPAPPTVAPRALPES